MSIVRDKVVLISGGLGGIGLAIIKELLDNGVKGIAVLDLQNPEANQLINKAAGNAANKVLYIPTDATNTSQIESAFNKTVETFKQLDVVINSAGILDEIRWRQCVFINLMGTMEITNLAIEKFFPKFCKGTEGVVLNIASIAGITSFHIAPTYCATKFGIVGFSKSIGEACVADKINAKVMCICPGFTTTPIVDETTIGRRLKTTEHSKVFNQIKSMAIQEPAAVAKGALNIIKNGNSGSCWVIEADETYEVEFKPYTEMKKKN